ARETLKQKLLREDPPAAARQQAIDELRKQTLTVEEAIRMAENRLALERRSFAERLLELEESHQCRRAALERETGPVFEEHEHSLRELREELAGLDTRMTDLEKDQESAIDRLFLGPESRDTGAALSSDAVDEERIQMPSSTPGTIWPRLIRFYHRAFGRLPATTRWHPYHTMLRPVMAALGTSAAGEILVVSSGGRFGSLLTREFAARNLTVTPGLLASKLYRQVFSDATKYNLCLCEPAADDLENFHDLLKKICMKDHSRIIVFHENLPRRSLDERCFEFTIH